MASSLKSAVNLDGDTIALNQSVWIKYKDGFVGKVIDLKPSKSFAGQVKVMVKKPGRKNLAAFSIYLVYKTDRRFKDAE